MQKRLKFYILEVKSDTYLSSKKPAQAYRIIFAP